MTIAGARSCLVEAHQEGETALGSVGFFVGFLIYLLLDELVPHPG